MDESDRPVELLGTASAGVPPTSQTPPQTPDQTAPAHDPGPVVPPVVVIGDGPPVVLLHAFPLDGRMWTPLAQLIAAGSHVLIPDFRGFGAGRHQAVPEAWMGLLADDVAALLDHHGIERAVLAGCSMGGYVAMAFARRHPSRLRALALLDTRADADNREGAAARLEMAERVLAEGSGILPGIMLPRLLGATSRERRPEVVGMVTELLLAQDPAAVAAAQRGMAARPDSTALLHGIETPVLVLVGEEDQTVPVEVAEGLAELAGGGRAVVIPEAGHLAALERPDAVATVLDHFLWSVGRSGDNPTKLR